MNAKSMLEVLSVSNTSDFTTRSILKLFQKFSKSSHYISVYLSNMSWYFIILIQFVQAKYILIFVLIDTDYYNTTYLFVLDSSFCQRFPWLHSSHVEPQPVQNHTSHVNVDVLENNRQCVHCLLFASTFTVSSVASLKVYALICDLICTYALYTVYIKHSE